LPLKELQKDGAAELDQEADIKHLREVRDVNIKRIKTEGCCQTNENSHQIAGAA